jgi:hypothetical protein
MTPRLIKSFFAGNCRTCGKNTPKGEQVWFAKHYGIRCQSCGPHVASDAPIPSKKKGRKHEAASTQPIPKSAPPATPPSRATGFAPLYTPASTRQPAQAGPDGVYRLGWTSISELVDDAFAQYAQSEASKDFLSALHKRHDGDTWANGHDETSLRKALSQPAKETLAEIDAMRRTLVNELALPTTARRKVRRGMEWGDDLDADRYLSREPNAWEQSVRDPATRRTVTIGVNLTVCAGQNADELLYRGAAAVALADLLTQRGINVRLIGFSVGEEVSSRMHRLVSTVEFKAADMPLDVASLATAVCDVGFFRMVVMPAEFRHLTGQVSTCLGIRGGQYLPSPDRMALDYLVESRVTTRESALDWLREQMAAQDAEVACA